MSHVATDTNWAVREFADAALGDERRTKRLVELANVLGQPATAALPEACGDGGRLKAAYRFFDHDAIEAQDMLHSHGASTSRRLEHVSVVLAVQDTTEVHGTGHPATQGLGPLGHTACQGLLGHTTLALTPARGPLGLLAQQGWARAPNEVGQRARRTQLPISQKESQPWRHRLDAVCTARDGCPTTRLVRVGDRAAEVSDVLAAARPAGGDLLLRASWDRCVGGPEHDVWATVEAQSGLAHLRLQVPRRGPQAARAATVALRFCPLTRCPPRHRQREGLPMAWLLLTTGAVETVDAAIERVQWYACRWGLAVWHRVLKSGCRMAERQVASGEPL